MSRIERTEVPIDAEALAGDQRRARPATSRAPAPHGCARAIVMLCAISTLCACETTLSLQTLDGLNRSIGAQTIALRETHTVYSPYDWVATRDFADLVGAEVEQLCVLLEIKPAKPVPVWLRATVGIRPKITGENGVMRFEKAGPHPHFGVEGYAGDEMVVVYVEEASHLQGADGVRITGSFAASTYQGTIRHELVHYLSFAARLRGDLWFNEGLPEEIETMRVADGKLVPDANPERLRDVASIPRKDRVLASVLDWREDAGKVHQGLERADIKSRVLAYSFVRFLLERAPARSFIDRTRWILSLSRRDLLRYDLAWQDWLDALSASPRAGAAEPLLPAWAQASASRGTRSEPGAGSSRVAR